MKYKKIHDGIIEIPGFISKTTCREMVEILKNIPEEFWIKNDSSEWDKRVLSDKKNIEFYTLKKQINEKIINLFKEYYKIVNDSVSIQRILPNTGGLSEHRDNITDTDVKYGMVLYYNDDYEGGEIEYPELNILYKPNAGSLIIHRGEYLHRVNEVFVKTRYMSTFFVHEIEDYPSKFKEFDL